MIGKFVVYQLFTRNFWFLMVASFTLVMMLAWRAHLRDQIFKAACGKFPLVGPRKPW